MEVKGFFCNVRGVTRAPPSKNNCMSEFILGVEESQIEYKYLIG